VGAEHLMIYKDGKQFKTIAEAAKEFGVSAKTVREWIHKGIIDEPPTIEQGIRTIAYFPNDYLSKSKEKVRDYRLKKQSKARR
jgi:predicted site-specific integrase-resolvase